MITWTCRLNTVLVALFLLAFVSTGYGFMSEKKKVVIHIPDEITYVKHFHPKIVYIKKKYHGSGYTSTTSSHGLKGVGTGGGGGHSSGRNPLKLLLSSEIHSTEIKPVGWSNQGISNQESFSVGNNNWPPNKLPAIVPNEVNNGWVENEIKLHDLHINSNNNNNEFPPLNTFEENTPPSVNFGHGQYGLPESEVAAGVFNEGNKDLGSDLHQSGSSTGGNNGVTSLGPQLFTNNGGNSGSGNNGFSHGGNNFQPELGHNEVHSIGNYGRPHGLELNGASFDGHGQNSGFSQQAIHNGHVNNNGNSWPVEGLADTSSSGNSPAWPENGVAGGSQTAGSNDWVPISYPPDNSLWWPMNVESWPQNHASQPQVPNNFNQGILNQNPGYGTQGGIDGNLYTGVTGNGIQESISYTLPYTQIQSSESLGQFTGSNIGNYQGNGNIFTSSVEVPWIWNDQTRPSELVNAGINGNAQNIIRHPEVSNNFYKSPNNEQNFESAGHYYGNGYPMSQAHRPNFESAANYGGYPVGANAIAMGNNAGIGAHHGVFPSNVNDVPHGGQSPSYGANSNSYSPAGNNLGSSNHHVSHTHNGFSTRPNIGSHIATGSNENHGGFNSYQSGYIKNANNIACKRLKQRKVKVDSYHPCYEPNNEATQESLSNVYYNAGNNNNHIDTSYNMPINGVNAHSGGSIGNYGTGNYNHANNGIYPLNSNVHGASINNHGSGGRNHNGLPFYANNINNYEENTVHSAPIYGPVKNAEINHFHQGYTETISSYSTNINNPNNIKNNNYGGIGTNGAVGNLNYENNEVGTHIVMGGSALASNGYYGPTGSAIAATNQAVHVNTKYTRAKIRPNIIANGVNSGPYEIPSVTNYGPSINHLTSASNPLTNYGGFINNPSHTGQSGSIYYEHNGNTYNPGGSTTNFGPNNNQGISNGPILPGSSNTYGGNNFEISSNIPYGDSGNLQSYSKAPIYGGNTYDAHSSPSSTNFGTLLTYANTGDNNLNLRHNDPSNNYFGRSGANRVPNSAPASNYGIKTNNYRSATNGSSSDITSEYGKFVSNPTNPNGQSTYRGNSNSFITSSNYGSITSKPHYAEVAEHRGLPFTTHVGRGPLAAANQETGGKVNSGGYTTPTQELNALNEIIQNSNIYKGIGNGIGANTDPNQYSLMSANFGVNSNHANKGVQSVPSKVKFVTNAEYKKPNSANLNYVAYTTPTKSTSTSGHLVYSPSTSASQGNIAYNTPTSTNHAHVYNTATSANQGSIAYSKPTSTNHAHVYNTATSTNQGNIAYNTLTSTNHAHVYNTATSANQGNIAYNTPTSTSHAHVYNTATNANQGNIAYSKPTSTNHGHVYSTPASVNQGNVVYRVPTSANHGHVVYSTPTSANHGHVYNVPISANHGNVLYNTPTTSNQGNVIYSIPTTTNTEHAAYNTPTNTNHGSAVYSAPIIVNDGKSNIYSLPNKLNHGKNNVNSAHTNFSPGNVPYTLPNSVNHGINNVYSVPSSGSQVNVEYVVPNRVSHGTNNVYSVPNSGSQNNVVYSVPNTAGNQENNVYVNKPSSQGNAVNNVPTRGNVANTVYSSPRPGTNNAYSVPNSGNQGTNHVYTVPNSASQGNNIVYSVPNGEGHGNVVYNLPVNPGHGNNIVYNVPNSGSHENVIYSVPSSANHGTKISYSLPNSGSHENIAYSVPSSIKHGNNVHRGPSAAALTNSAPQTFPGSEVFENPSTYKVANSGNEGYVGPYRLPGGDNYRNASGFGLSSSHHQVGNAALQGLTSSDNRGNNAAYDSFSSSSRTKNPKKAQVATNSGNQNVPNPFSSTNFVNHVNRLVSSDSNRNVAYRVPSEGSNTSSIAQSGSNINHAYSEPSNGNVGNSVFTVSNSVNHGNNAYSVSNSVRHINSAFSVETSSANGKGEQGTKSVQEESSNRNRSKRPGKRRRLKNGHHKVMLPDSGSSERDIISNIHEEAIKFVENYKVPAHGNFGPGESPERQWNTRQNVRSMNGDYSNRKSRHTGKVEDYVIQNDDNRVNNYTPSGPGNDNLANGSRIPFNVNRPGNRRNYVNRPLRNFGNGENHATSDAATRNYTTNNSYGGYNSRTFRGI